MFDPTHLIAFAFGMLAAGRTPDLSTLEKSMSAFSDKLDEIGTHVDAAAARVSADVSALKTQIAALQAAVTAGGLTPEDQTQIDALKAKLDAIDPAATPAQPGGTNPDPNQPPPPA